ncbi:hypothetical protein F4802DRAFT_610310 [Xylaria palmicola]|nr:hypothetical protein F4802DRAFT_610310 [Xylaria palmicola]
MAHDNRKASGDIDRRTPAESSPEASDSKHPSSRSKTGIRVSLACVQCRSKQYPACRRCLVEGKPCYYTKSRRGIRDPKKRSLIVDTPPTSSPQHISRATKSAPLQLPFDVPKSLPDGWSASRPADTNTNESLVDAFFDHFHHGHPVLPPKRFFLIYVESDPNLYHFLLSVINLCGALYVGHAQLNDLREAAYSAACGPLPFTVQSIQGLYLLAVIAFGESKFLHYIGFAKRSWEMAIELGMHRKCFADRTSDTVWAESYRRTWWYLKFQGMVMRVNALEPTIDTYDVESDADIPCSEEWEYQSGDIPLPVSILQYERDVNFGRPDVSSLAYLIEMCRMQADILRLYSEIDSEDEKGPDIFNQADTNICDLLRRIPPWKMDVVDPNGKPDQVLFGAVAWAHVSRILLRQSALRKGFNLREYFPLGPNHGPDRKGQAVKPFGWNPHPIDIQAANSVCDLFRSPFPIKNLPPMMVPGLLRVAIVYLDACVFLGLDSPTFRARINTLIRILKIHGEIWPLSQKIAEDIQAVVDEYLDSKDQFGAGLDAWNAMGTDAMSSAPFFEPTTTGADPYSFLDSQLQRILLEFRDAQQQTMHSVVSSSQADGLVSAYSGP